jgi:capsular polysaccharide export protein
MAHVMEVVLESFARGAPKHAMLLIKLHPLDNGIANFRKQATRIARRLNLGDRILVMDGGHLPTLLSRCEGVVVVNSTTGLSALRHGQPVTVLGSAIFNLPGLTFQGPLDDFWQAKSSPDQDLFQAFRQVVLTKAQINGSFFTDEGLKLAVEGSLARMRVLPVQAPAEVPSRLDPVSSLAAAEAPLLLRQ